MNKISKIYLVLLLLFAYVYCPMLMFRMLDNSRLLVPVSFCFSILLLVIGIDCVMAMNKITMKKVMKSIRSNIARYVISLYTITVICLMLVNIIASKRFYISLFSYLVLVVMAIITAGMIATEVNHYLKEDKIEYKILCMKNIILTYFSNLITKQQLELQIKNYVKENSDSNEVTNKKLEYQYCYELLIYFSLKDYQVFRDILQSLNNTIDEKADMLVDAFTNNYLLTKEQKKDLINFVHTPSVFRILFSMSKT